MNRFMKYYPALFAVLILCGCTQNSGNSVSEAESSGTAGNAQTSDSAADSGDADTDFVSEMPVISIETVSHEKDVMDFVTKPVAAHVAKEISSWTPNYVFPPAPYYEACSVTVTAPDQTEILSSADAEVKVRGNWTTTYNKKPLRIKFAEKQSFLDLNHGAEAKNWLLLAEYKDASLLRDKAALQAAREILDKDGLYASDAALAEVIINGEYWGVYLVAEQQQVHPDRVNITEPDQDFTDPMTGYFLEFDGYYYNEEPLQQCFVNYADNAPLKPFDGEDGGGRTMCCLPEEGGERKKKVGFSVKSPVRSQEQHDFIQSYLNNVYQLMYAAAYENKAYVFNDDFSQITETAELTPQEAVEKAVDVQSLADLYLISEFIIRKRKAFCQIRLSLHGVIELK